MSEKFVTRERVFFSASALTAAGLGAIAFKLIQRHREQDDTITLEGVDQEVADHYEAATVPQSDEPIDSDVAYVGVEDSEYRASAVDEVHAIGEPKHFTRLRRRVINGAVFIQEKIKKEDN